MQKVERLVPGSLEFVVVVQAVGDVVLVLHKLALPAQELVVVEHSLVQQEMELALVQVPEV